MSTNVGTISRQVPCSVKKVGFKNLGQIKNVIRELKISIKLDEIRFWIRNKMLSGPRINLKRLVSK